MPLDPLQGVVVPAITPLLEDGGLDRSGLLRLVDSLAAAGVHGVMVGGTTGEALALPRSVRIELITEAAIAARDGGLKCVAGIAATSLDDILNYSRAAADAGADYVALHPPPFFPFTEDALGGFYRRVLDESRLPLFIYTIPSFAGNSVSPSLVEELSREPGVVGIKDSTGDLEYFKEVSARCASPEFQMMVGSEPLMVQGLVDCGADGIVASIGNLFPHRCVTLYDLARDGDREGAMAIQEELQEVVGPMLKGRGWIAMIRWIKSQIAEKGICEPVLSPLFAETSQVGERV